MKYNKIISIVTGISLVAAALMPVQAHALSTASMTLSGASQSNGSFSVIVYEDTGSDTVTGAKVELSFSQAVSGVSYDYSVGPFTAVTPSGAHNAYGTVTGTNPVARVSFNLAAPGSVTASVNGNSYLKHAEGTTVENFAIAPGSANFTYTAPVTGGSGGGSGTGSTSSTGSTGSNATHTTSTGAVSKVATTSTPAATDNGSVAGAETDNSAKNDSSKKDDKKSNKKSDSTKKTADKKSASKAWLWWVIALVVVAGLYLLGRRGSKAAEAEEAKAAAEATAAAEVVKPVTETKQDTPKSEKATKGNKPGKNKSGRTKKTRR